MSDITVSVGVDSKGAEQGAARVGRSLDDIRKKSKQVEDQTKRTGVEFARLGTVLKTAIGAATVRQVVQYADSYKNLESRLKTVTRSEAELNRVRKETLQIANQTRSSLEGTVALYTRVARNIDQLGISQEKVLRVTELTNKAIQIGGSSAQEAAAGVIQFAQALASGRLQGDELRSILENMPVLAKAISDGLGVTIGDLRRMGADGELTAKKIVEALLSQGAALDGLFGKVNLTIGQAFTVLNNQIITFIGETDKATGISTSLAQAILVVADNLDTVADGLAVVGVALTSRLLGPVLASTAAMAQNAVAGQTMAASALRAALAERELAESAILASRVITQQHHATLAAAEANIALARSQVVATSAAGRFERAMSGMKRGIIAIGGAGGALLTAVAALFLFSDEIDRAAKHGNRFAQAVDFILDKIGELADFMGGLFLSAVDQTSLALTAMGEVLGIVDYGTFQMLRGMQEQRKAMQTTLEAVDELAGEEGKPGGIAGLTGETNKLQEALDKLQGDAVYDTLVVGLDESKRAMLDLDVAVGKLTKEYGPLSEAQQKQVKTIREQTLEAVKAKQAYEAQQKALEDALERSEELRREFLRPFENAADDMQSLFKDTFKDIFSGGVNSFGDLAKRVKGIFFDLAGQIAALMIFRPQVLSAGGGIGGAVDAVFSGGGSLGGGKGGFGLGDLASAGSLLSNLAGTSILPSGITGAVGDLSTTLFGDSLLFGNLADGLTLGGMAAGFGGSMLSKALFGSSGIGSTVGGFGGQLAGAALGTEFLTPLLGAAGGPVGALLGAFAGSALGGLFGNKKPSDKTSAGSIALGGNTTFDLSAAGGKKFSQENQDLRDLALSYAASLADIIADETGKKLDQELTLQIGNRDGLRYRFGGRTDFVKAGDPNALLRGITEEMALIAEESGAASATLENLRTAIKNVDFKEPEKALQDLAFAANFDKLLDAPEKLTATEQALNAITQQMDQLRETTERLGLSVEAVNQLEATRIAQLKQATLNASAIGFLEQVAPGVAAIASEILGFNEAIKELEAIGVDTTFVRLRHDQKMVELTRALMEEENGRLRVLQDQSAEASRLVETYTELSKTLKEAAKSLRIGNLSKLSSEERVKEARGLFEQTLQSALSGDIEASGQLSGVGNALLELSRGYFAGGKGFSQDFDMVETGLLKVAAEATRQADLQERAIQGVERQIGAIQDNTRQVVSVIERLIRTNAEDLPAKLATLIAGAGGVSNLAGAVVSDDRGTFLKSNANEMLVAALGSGSPVGMEILRQAGYTGAFGGGAAARAVESDQALDARVKQIARSRGIPGFARGGYPALFSPSLVGENGPEFITPMSPVRIDPMHSFRPMPANDNMGQVVFELRQLVGEMKALGEDIAASNVGQGKLARDMQGTMIRINGKLDKLAAQS